MKWDYLIFAAIMITLAVNQELVRIGKIRRAVRQFGTGLNKVIAFYRVLALVRGASLLILLIGGWLITDYYEDHARLAFHDASRGLGLTMAREITRLGHADLRGDAPSTDIRRLAIGGALAEWLQFNPVIESAYTIRRQADGTAFLVLDPQTGTERHGALPGPRETGKPAAAPEIAEAFAGRTAFQNEPRENGHGIVVSMFTPLFAADGRVEAVLGVDFSAEKWREALLAARITSIGGLLVLVLLMNAFFWLLFNRRFDAELSKLYTAELAESEARFRNLANHAPVLLQLVGPQDNFYFFNQTWRDFTGIEAAGQTWLELIHPDDLTAFAACLRQNMAERSAFQAEFRLRHANGGYRWMTATYIPRWRQGGFAGYVGSCVDITPYKQLAETLGRQLEFEKLIAAISASFINVAGGREDRLITLALEQIARYAEADGGAIFLLSDSGDITVSHNWRGEGVALPFGGRRDLSRADHPWLMAQLAAGICHVADIADLPPAAANEKAFLDADGIKSMVAVPLLADGRLLGMLAFVGKQPKIWPDEYLSLLRIVGEIFVGAIRRRQAEAALRKSEARNKAILDSVPDIMYQVDREGGILDLKPCRHHPEQASPALIGTNFADLLPAHLVKPALDAIARVLDSGQGQLFEYYRQNGEITYYEGRFAKVGDEEVLIIVRDITERRRSEACDLSLLDITVKVLEEEPLDDILAFACRQITAIFGLSLVWVGNKEDSGRVRVITGGEEAAEVVAGADMRWDDSPAGQGPTGTAIRTGTFQTINADDERARPWRGKLCKHGANAGVSFPLRIGGRIFGALTAFAPDDAFWSKRAIVHLTNFAEQLALAIHATNSRQRLHLLTAGLTAAANAVAIISRDGKIQWVNPAFLKLTGYTAAEALQENVRFLEAGRSLQTLPRKQLWPTLRAGRAWQGEFESRRKDGSRYIAETTITPVRDERGEIVNYIAIIQDVTSRRQAEQEMLTAREAVARAERLMSLGVMAAGIAHEVNQPLNSLKVTADSMLYWHGQGKTPTLAKIMENIEKISRQADRIASIIQHMRAFVHSSQSTLPATCDINAAVEETFSLLGAQLAAHGIAVHTNLAAGLPPVLANTTQLEEVIINLLVNALQSLDTFDLADKRIDISTCRQGDQIVLEISDNGPGISEKHKSKVFEPFFTTKPASEGMGLGLSIVHSIVTGYGGEISLKCGKQGKGVTFRVEFPACTGKERREARA